MKKLLIPALIIFVCTNMTYAQDDCSYLFPKTKGTTMTTQCYDAQDNLLGVTTYLVSEEYDNALGSMSDIVYSLENTNGDIVNAGSIESTCENGDVYIKTKSKADPEDITKMLSANINLLGYYLDYPDTYDPMDPFDGTFNQGEADLTLKLKDKSMKPIRVRIYDRNFEKNESITTPAGTFDTSKVSYMVDIYDGNDKTTQTYKNIEWYSLGKGFIRSEIYDNKGNLIDYSVLTVMNEK